MSYPIDEVIVALGSEQRLVMPTLYPTKTASPEPVWDFAQLFPTQGQWDEEDYFAIETNQLIEFSHGQLEVLGMPSIPHQLITLFLFRLLDRFVEAQQLGRVLLAPTKIQLWPSKYCEPDLIVIFSERLQRHTEQYWIGADLVIEVVSPGDRPRDTKTKRREYAQAGIPEYWLVDPEYETVTVLTLSAALAGEGYRVYGEFKSGEQANARLLAGFSVDVNELFASGEL